MKFLGGAKSREYSRWYIKQKSFLTFVSVFLSGYSYVENF